MIFLGFDPGGGSSFGCWIVSDRKIEGGTVGSVDEAIDWTRRVCADFKPAAAGIDTLLFWQTTPSGWRGADEYLRRRYPLRRNSVLCSNGLYGSMAVQGATLAMRLRTLWPDLYLTETHPKVLWEHLATGCTYPREPERNHGAIVWLSGACGHQIHVRNEHEFDAALSAWAAREGYNGVWAHDLALERASQQRGENVQLVPDVHYVWPD